MEILINLRLSHLWNFQISVRFEFEKAHKGKPYYVGLLLNGQTIVPPISRMLLTLIM